MLKVPQTSANAILFSFYSCLRDAEDVDRNLASLKPSYYDQHAGNLQRGRVQPSHVEQAPGTEPRNLLPVWRSSVQPI